MHSFQNLYIRWTSKQRLFNQYLFLRIRIRNTGNPIFCLVHLRQPAEDIANHLLRIEHDIEPDVWVVQALEDHFNLSNAREQELVEIHAVRRLLVLLGEKKINEITILIKHQKNRKLSWT